MRNMITNIDKIINYIKGSNDFVVTSHISPDGDNIGSTLGIYYTLKKMGKNVYYVIDDNAPLNLRFLVKDVKRLTSIDFKELNIQEYSLVSLDCGDKSRVCVSEDIKENAKSIICIDHHASNDAYGDLNYIEADASSTCELVYNILVRLSEIDTIDIIDSKIATALYTGLVTD
ncbi:MAG: DHH family phosphoesterase, partial [Peptostreptococcaceae bacterium]